MNEKSTARENGTPRRIGRQLASKATFTFALFDSVSITLLLALPLLCFGFCRTVHTSWPTATTFDFYLFAYSPSTGLPLIWFMCPLMTMIMLGRMWNERLSESTAVFAGSRASIWRSCIGDVMIVSIICALIVHASLFLIGMATTNVLFDENATDGPFAYYLEGREAPDLQMPYVLVLTFFYALLSLIVSNLLFFVLYGLLKFVPAYFIVSVLAYPEVHKAHSIVHDAVSAFGGNLLARNPLSYFYETASVFYPSWLPGQSHQMWFLAAMAIVLAGLSWTVLRKREFLH